MKKLAQLHPDKLLDLLTERLAFERMVVKLYDGIISRMKVSKDTTVVAMIGRMISQRNEERDHEDWLEEQVFAMGSDPHAETELSALVEREGRGILDVVAHDDDPNHLFHALLTAELVDDTGWKLLLQLADEADDEAARKDFRLRAEAEERHLLFVRGVVAAFARKDVLGKTVQIPAVT